MAGTDRVIDPVTRDYVEDGAGGWEETRNASTAVYFQVQIEKGNWAGRPGAGSRFHQLARAKSSQRTVAVLSDMAREAMQPLVDAGLISEPTIVVERDVNRIASETTVVDQQTGEELDLGSLLPFTG